MFGGGKGGTLEARFFFLGGGSVEQNAQERRGEGRGAGPVGK